MSDSSIQSNVIGPGSLIGRYRIEHALGSGGMADVFYALHEDLRRPAAIKILKASLAADETNLQRFMNEARSAASLVHPNIVQVYDVGRDKELRYIAQEFIPGVNLRQYLASTPNEKGNKSESSTDSDGNQSPGRNDVFDPTTGDRQLSLTETLSILLQVLAALNKSESSGIVHRDIKPENIMLNQDGSVKVADFGLARTFLGDDPKLTRAGTTLGTPMYMSPEQIQGDNVDIRSDLYSLGITLYHMLAGRPPFVGETQLALAMMHTQAEVPDIEQFRPDTPPSLKRLLDRLLSKDPANRIRSVDEVLAFLQKNRSGDLASFWPERTQPLPRAIASPTAAAMAATHRLQTLVGRKPKTSSGTSRWLARLVAGMLWLVALFIGFFSTMSSPFRLDEPSKLFFGVPKMETAEEQYHWALVHDEVRASRANKWKAVQHYFPADESPVNRNYAGQAAIQLARALRDAKDWTGALKALDETINDTAIDQFIRAYAYIEKAVTIESEARSANPDFADEEGRVRAAVSDAREIHRQEPIIRSTELKSQIDAIVERHIDDAPSTREIWIGLTSE